MSRRTIVTVVTVAAICSTAAYGQQKLTVAGTVVTNMASAAGPAAIATAPVAQGMKMTATLTPQKGGTVAGTGTVQAGSSASTTVATVSLTGGTPGAVYPWHVHVGKCGMTPGGKVWGDGSAYKPLKVGSDGTATSTATISMAPPTTGDYYVNIHASPSDLGTIVSCGNLGM
jgi:Cu/Zn superoxide dismutase